MKGERVFSFLPSVVSIKLGVKVTHFVGSTPQTVRGPGTRVVE